MILLEIRDYLKAAGSAPVRDLALHFKISEEDATSMVEHWVKKGMAKKLPAGSLCQSSCRSCDPDSISIYEWNGPN
ncbi:MAG: sugar metabolism transcriptional regulator [Cycloclasticus sp. symbiont of Bathymodiolus heckerae]|nr:MAG: sugar metabolism transcriptional regulator [Cycloclasticus sp. symbiont of Bathymodiolus heckerae]